VRDGDTVKHYRIRQLDEGGFFIARRVTFRTLADLVEHYGRDPDGLCVNLKKPSLLVCSYFCLSLLLNLPSVLWRCWSGCRKGIRPVKTEWWGAGVVICLERGADLHMAQLMPLPLTVSCFGKIQISFTFLVPAHLSSPGKRAVKRVCVCVCDFLLLKCWL